MIYGGGAHLTQIFQSYANFPSLSKIDACVLHSKFLYNEFVYVSAGTMVTPSQHRLVISTEGMVLVSTLKCNNTIW